MTREELDNISPATIEDKKKLRQLVIEYRDHLNGKESELADLAKTVLYFLSYMPDTYMDDRKTQMLYRLALKIHARNRGA